MSKTINKKKKKFKLGPKQKQWIKALKSGKYKQCKSELCNGVGYCCLGVANEIFGLKETNDQSLENTYEKLGLYNDIGELDTSYKFPRGGTIYLDLAQMNDNNVGFKKIAEFIEKNPELVFNKSV